LAGVFDVHRNSGEIFDHDFAREAGIAAGTAGRDDYFLEVEKSFLDGSQRIRENDVAVHVLPNGFTNGFWLLVNFVEHVIRKWVRRTRRTSLLVRHLAAAPGGSCRHAPSLFQRNGSGRDVPSRNSQLDT